jgi:glycosyltransferase involved in cell wall biosynthesis
VHLTALVKNPQHVCCRYRLTAFAPFLHQAGHRLELCSWPVSWWRRLWLGRRVRGADLVIVQRRLLRRWQLALLRRNTRLLVFDFDDALFLRDSYADNAGRWSDRRSRFAATVRSADAVVAGNSFLAAEADRWTGTRRALVIPTCIDPARYLLARHVRAEGGVQLAWIGSASTLRGLEAIQPLLNYLGQQWPGLRLKLICDRFLRLRHLPVIECPWSEAGEAAALASADIGISWLPDDPWSRGKCALKVLQYMAAGLPVVANPVGVQAELVVPGETGFLAETPQEWADAVRRLARDPALRQSMGRAGRQRVETEFSVSSGAARWLSLLEHLSQPGKGSGKGDGTCDSRGPVHCSGPGSDPFSGPRREVA